MLSLFSLWFLNCLLGNLCTVADRRSRRGALTFFRFGSENGHELEQYHSGPNPTIIIACSACSRLRRMMEIPQRGEYPTGRRSTSTGFTLLLRSHLRMSLDPTLIECAPDRGAGDPWERELLPLLPCSQVGNCSHKCLWRIPSIAL